MSPLWVENIKKIPEVATALPKKSRAGSVLSRLVEEVSHGFASGYVQVWTCREFFAWLLTLLSSRPEDRRGSGGNQRGTLRCLLAPPFPNPFPPLPRQVKMLRDSLRNDEINRLRSQSLGYTCMEKWLAYLTR